jgi:hypothetical protein
VDGRSSNHNLRTLLNQFANDTYKKYGVIYLVGLKVYCCKPLCNGTAKKDQHSSMQLNW